MLTRKQYDLLILVHAHLARYGVSPSFDEMRDGLSLKSKSGVHRLLEGLEERGFLRRLPNRARALEVLRLPENIDREALPIRARRTDKARGESFGNRPAMLRPTAGPIIQIPLYGRIAAGTPIEALRDENMMVEVPGTMLGKGDHYALEIEGDSMIDAGIFDGDTVVIERRERAEIGDIVVALIEESEATLKRFNFQNNKIALEPANRHYATHFYSPGDVRIQGRLVGLLRKY